MKLGRLNHVGVAVPDMDQAIAFWRETMGATQVTEPFDMPEQGVRVCFVDTPNGGTQFEEMGKRVLGPTRIGAHGTPIFFVHPRDMGGILTEIMETAKGAHA